MDCDPPPRLLCPWDFPGKNTGQGWQEGGGLPFPSPGDLPNPRIKPTSPVLAGKLFIYEPPGKSPLRPEAKPKTPEVAAAVDCQTEGQISPWGPFTLGFKTTLAGWSARVDEGISALKEL